MKISFNWLKELVALPTGVTSGEVARRLTMAGLEVESIDRRGQEVTGVRVAEVRGVRAHPESDKLRIVRVAAVQSEEEVVCGAPNVPPPGGRVAWAPPGATLPGGITLVRKQVRGFDSPGMLCSERELGIGEAADGIITLPDDAAVGADIAQLLGLLDDVFEVNVTPNRADALSHVGVAREVAAAFAVTWGLPELDSGSRFDGDSAMIPVEIRAATLCRRYHGTVIRGVRVGPSPLPMRVRLGACGMRAISNLVDVTNYVMLLTGQPLHAFDLDKISAGVVVRPAADGERMETLDGVHRSLEPGDIVIADARAPIALAGVMGGATSEVTAGTTNVFLESATFDPVSVRRTAKRLGLHSEASHRFERGVDPNGVGLAGMRAASLITRLAGGRIAAAPNDQYVAPLGPRRVSLAMSTLRRTAGFEIAEEIAADKLRAIEIPVSLVGQQLVATVPTFRPDVTIEEDLVEEVMRLVGYDHVPVKLPAGGKAPEPSPERLADRARDLLAAQGLYEIVSWAFVPRARLQAFEDAGMARAIAVQNPISADYEVMRTSLLPGLVDAARRNVVRGVVDVGLFEVGPVVHALAGEAHHIQSDRVAVALAGRRAGWLKPGDPIDFFDLKRVLAETLAGLGLAEPDFIPAADNTEAVSFLHPGASAVVKERGRSDGENVGLAGQLHPRVARRLGIDVPIFVFELGLDSLESRGQVVRAVSPPRFPAVTRDISFWIDAGISAESQRTAMRGAGGSLLRDIAVLEDFRDAQLVPAGKKGMLWTLTYRADDRTLTDSEVDAAHARVVDALRAAFAGAGKMEVR